MASQDSGYQKLTQEEIQNRLENALSDKLDTEAQPGDLITAQLKAEAETLAENQEEALERVYNSAYLADATGEELDKVVGVIGVTRQEATTATGTARFSRDTPAKSEYTIPRGSQIQADESEPLVFETTEKSALAEIDRFENGDLNKWNGDTGSVSVVATSNLSGSYVAELPATSGVRIETDRTDFKPGTTFTAEIYPSSGSVTGLQFGIQDSSNYFEAVVDEAAQDLKLRLVEGGSEVSLSDNTTASIPADSASYLEVHWGLYEDTEAVLYSTENRETELCSVTMSDSREWGAGPVAVLSKDSTATSQVDTLSTRSVVMNIESQDAGTKTNLGPDTIRVITESITGVEAVSNPVATGNPSNLNTDWNPFVLGEDRENDEELRERAFNTTSIGGSASVNAIDTEISRVDGVKALTLNRNREESTVNGLPPHSFEAIVYGGSDEDIARAIFKAEAIDSHDVGGINGNGASYIIQSSVTGDTEEINWSRPNKIDLNFTLDLIVDDTYVGDEEIRSAVTNYVGGTGLDGNFVNGLNVGEDVYSAVLKREVVGPDETGVWEVDSLTIDSGTDGTDDTTTTASGAEVLAVADNEVAITNARDGSITINTTQK